MLCGFLYFSESVEKVLEYKSTYEDKQYTKIYYCHYSF